MSTIEQTLNAGVPVTFPGGEQFHLLEADDPVDVIFYDSRNRPMETWGGMKGGFRIVFEKGFIQVRLESATGQTVKLGITSGRGEYDRSQGDVNILNIVKDNSWYYDSLQKKAFIGSGDASASAAEYSCVQLWNPAASGKILMCSKLWAMTNAVALSCLALNHHSAALLTAGIQGNKYLAEAAGAGLVKQGYPGAITGTNIENWTMQPNKFTPLNLDAPITIGQGLGLVAGIDDDQTKLYVCFQWTEIPA